MNKELLNKLDYDSKFEIIKQHVKQLPLIEKFKFLNEYDDKRLFSYFRNKFIIPINFNILDDYFDNIDNIPISTFIYMNKFEKKTDFFVYDSYKCVKKCDIPILEWWLYTGFFENDRTMDLVYMISKQEFTKEYDGILFIDSIILPDIEVLEWFSKNNIKIEGAFNIFINCFIHNGFLQHCIWMFNYFKKLKHTNEYNQKLLDIMKSPNILADMYYYILSVKNHYIFYWLISVGFDYNKDIYSIIKTTSLEEESYYVLEFLEKYNKSNNMNF